MDWAALSYWISHRVAPRTQDLGAIPWAQGSGREGHRDLQASECVVVPCGAASPAGLRNGRWCWADVSVEAPGPCGAELLWWSSVRTVAFHLGSVNLISVSLTQWLPHTWNVSDSGPEQWAGPDRVGWWSWSFRASVLRLHCGSRNTDTRLCMHGT